MLREKLLEKIEVFDKSLTRSNDLTKIKNLLSQLGITPFFKTKKPTPYDEA